MEITRTVHASVLLGEVKKHPVIYDNRTHSGHNTELKRKAWDIIAEKICGQEVWDTYDELDKDSIVKEFQIKWKNLKDNFTRILKREQMDALEGNSKRRKKYIYHDQMCFLKPFITNKQMRNILPDEDEEKVKEEMDCTADSGENPSIIYINEPDETTNGDKATESPFHPSLTSIGGSIGTLTPIQLVQINPNASTSVQTQRADADDSCGKALQLLAQLQQEDRTDDAMGNRKFLLSLLPFLQKLTDDVNLEVRMQLMSVLHNYIEKS